jgi:glycosyltransferase involved in cell wall biosynthesis
MRRVLLGTPAHDGRVDVWYCNSLVNTIKLAAQHDVQIDPIYMSYDSLIQRARNDLVRLALEQQYDDLIFMDSDQEWDPAWIFRLLAHEPDVVGGTVVKKSDQTLFNVKALKSGLALNSQGLIEVESVGTGFLRISRRALEAIWDISEEYINEGRKCRMVFDVRLIDGELVSEDNVFCAKWRGLGNSVWIDPSMTCAHIGAKKYHGNFIQFLNQHKLLNI